MSDEGQTQELDIKSDRRFSIQKSKEQKKKKKQSVGISRSSPREELNIRLSDKSNLRRRKRVERGDLSSNEQRRNSREVRREEINEETCQEVPEEASDSVRNAE